MEKEIKIKLSGRTFYIESSALPKLERALAHFKKDGTVRDAEQRLSTHFESRRTGEGWKITEKEVDEAIKIIGWPGAFRDEEEEETFRTKLASRKLMRSRDNVKIGGVCAGIALYLGIDPIIIRTLTFSLVFTYGVGLLLYLILLLLMPPNRNEKEVKVKKLYRDMNHNVIGGVAAGLGNYFKIDVLIFRILFVFPLLLMALAGISRRTLPRWIDWQVYDIHGSFSIPFPTLFLIYIILLLFVPKKRSRKETA